MELSQLDKIGPHIAAYRNKAGLTQQELADKTDLSVQFIGYIENGNRSLSLKSLVKITNALNINLLTFLAPFEQEDEQLGQLIQKIEHNKQQDTYIDMFINILDTAEEN